MSLSVISTIPNLHRYYMKNVEQTFNHFETLFFIYSLTQTPLSFAVQTVHIYLIKYFPTVVKIIIPYNIITYKAVWFTIIIANPCIIFILLYIIFLHSFIYSGGTFGQRPFFNGNQ